jgi:hypothetical protein
MDRAGELAAVSLRVLERKEPYLRVAVRDGHLVEDTMAISENIERESEAALDGRVALGGQVAQLIDDAKSNGCADFADRLEDCFTAFLNGLPKAHKRAVLLMAYDAAIRRPRTFPA